MRTENRTHITAGNICKNTQQFTLRKYILSINSIIDIMQYSLTGTGLSSMSTLAPVTTRTMSTVLQEMGDLCSIISAVLPYFRTTSSKTYLYPATPPSPPRTTLLLQLTTSRSQPSATIRSFWHTPSKCPPETQDQRGCLSQYKKKIDIFLLSLPHMWHQSNLHMLSQPLTRLGFEMLQKSPSLSSRPASA